MENGGAKQPMQASLKVSEYLTVSIAVKKLTLNISKLKFGTVIA